MRLRAGRTAGVRRTEKYRMEKVSIIIPVYNAAMYLDRCLESVTAQSYRNLEIIVVNDGSTDSSLAVCEEYEKKDSRIVLIDKENTGVSDSRNQAMGRATGKYLQFMDSDDWLTPDATEKLVTLAEMTGCDMVIGDFYRVDGERFSLKSHIQETKVMSREEFAAHMMEEPADFYYGVMWNKLYRRSVVEEYGLSCSTELNWCEDFLFNLSYIRRADTFCALQAPVYYYVKRKGSLVASELKKTSAVKVRLLLLEEYRRLYQSMGLYEDNKVKINGFVLAIAKDGHVSRMPGNKLSGKLEEGSREAKKMNWAAAEKKEKKAKLKKAQEARMDKAKLAYTRVEHTFGPVYDSRSRVLILGTFPSVKSRETAFYYGHPRNRFWKVMAALWGEAVPETVEEKKRLLLEHGVAIWDVVQSCDIRGSSDSSIRNVRPADIPGLLKRTGIRQIYANGDAAFRLYRKYCEKQTGIPAVRLPSTSPANAVFSLERLTAEWGKKLLRRETAQESAGQKNQTEGEAQADGG